MHARMLAIVAIGGMMAAGLTAQQMPPRNQNPQRQGLTPEQAMEYVRERLEAGELEEAESEQALELTQNILERNPNDVGALLLAGELLLERTSQVDFDRARQYFRQAKEIEPSNFRANLGLGRIWLASRVPRQAAQVLEEAERVAPRDKRSMVKRMLATAYTMMGEYAGAVTKAEEAVQEDPDDLDALRVLAEIRMRTAQNDSERLQTAIKSADSYVEKATELWREDPAKRERLENLIRAQQVELSALRAYHQSLYEVNYRGDPTDELRAGEEAAAAAVLVRMAEKVRRQSELETLLTEHDVLVMIERAVEYEPKNPAYLEWLATTCERIADRTRAIETWRQLLEVDPNNEKARERLNALGVDTAPTDNAAASTNPE